MAHTAAHPLPHEREATPEHLADGDSIVMGSPLRMESKRSMGKQTLLYAIPVVIVLGAAAWLAIGGGSTDTGTAANGVSSAFTTGSAVAPTGETSASQANSANLPVTAKPVRNDETAPTSVARTTSVASRARSRASAPIPTVMAPGAETGIAADTSAIAPEPMAAQASPPAMPAPQPKADLPASVDAAPAELQPLPPTPNPVASDMTATAQ